jgi:arylsulfatase A-like enzyme
VDEHIEAPQSGDGILPTPGQLFVDDRPVAAIVHLLPPHGPYSPPAPYLGRYTAWWPGDPPAFNAGYLNRIVRPTSPAIDPDYVRYVRDRYDENAAWADALVGNLVDRLRTSGHLEETLLVVASDHGEAFYEHGRFLHTEQVYRESLHVPLLIRWPAGTGEWAARVRSPVSLVDLLPTIAEAAALPAPWDRLQGSSLLSVARGVPTPTRPSLASTLRATRHFHPARPLSRLRVGSTTLIRDEWSDEVELYDLAEDPLQQRDLAAADPLRTAFLAQQLALMRTRSERLRMAESSAGAPLELDPSVVEELRALGYIQ